MAASKHKLMRRVRAFEAELHREFGTPPEEKPPPRLTPEAAALAAGWSRSFEFATAEFTLLRRGQLRRVRNRLAVLRDASIRIDSPDLPCIVEVDFSTAKGGVQCDRLTILRRTDGPEIGTQRVRELPVSGLIDAARRRFLFRLDDPTRGLAGGVTPIGPMGVIPPLDEDGLPPLDSFLQLAAALEFEQTPTDPPKKGKRRSDADMDRFVEQYRATKALGGRGYQQRLASELHYSIDTVKKWTREARRRGLLGENE